MTGIFIFYFFCATRGCGAGAGLGFTMLHCGLSLCADGWVKRGVLTKSAGPVQSAGWLFGFVHRCKGQSGRSSRI